MSNLLAESLMSPEEALVQVSLYYIYKRTEDGNRQIRVLKDEDGKKRVDNGDEDVSVINTKWRIANWQEQNRIIIDSQILPDPMNPAAQGIGQIDWNRYRDLRIKTLLAEWDLEFDNVIVPVTGDTINKMPVEIIVALYNKYEEGSMMDSEEQGKS